MLKFFLILVVVVFAVSFIVKFKVFFIAGGILAVAAFITFKVIKNDKAAPKEVMVKETKEIQQPKPESITNSYEVTGVVFYLNNLLSMSEPNYLYKYKKQDLIDTCNYDIPIYKNVINAQKLELIHEPDNEHDPNAIMVVLDGKLVGYMPAKECKHILHLMENDLIVSVKYEAYGGKYKCVNEDYDAYRDKSTYTMDQGEDEYGITVHVTEKVVD